MDIQALPYPCLRKVFDFLPVKDLLKCVGICPQWKHFASLKKSLRIVPQYVLETSDDDIPVLFTFESQGIGLSTLFSEYFTKVESLDISEIPLPVYKCQIIVELAKASIKLTTLNVGWCDHFYTYDFNNILTFSKNLTSFSGMFSAHQKIDTNNFLHGLFRAAKNLSTLNLKCSAGITSDLFAGISLRLKVLNLCGCKNLTPDVLRHIVGMRDTLEELWMRDVFFRTQEDMDMTDQVMLISQFTKLKVLDLPGCSSGVCSAPAGSGTYLSYLSSLHHLTQLVISGYCIHECDIERIITGCPRLSTLELFQSAAPMDHHPAHAMHLFTRLQSLKVFLCAGMHISDDVLKCWATHMINLEQLHLGYRNRVTAEGIGYLHRLPNIKKITCYGMNFQLSEKEKMEKMLSVFSDTQERRGQLLDMELHEDGVDETVYHVTEWRDEMVWKYSHDNFSIRLGLHSSLYQPPLHPL